MQESNYYTLGMKVGNSDYMNNDDKYLCNGKAPIEVLHGLECYDYGARMYDAALGRWHCVDNLAEKYDSYSPYHYAGNNPIRNFDIDGNEFTQAAQEWVDKLFNKIEGIITDLTNDIDNKNHMLVSGKNQKGELLTKRQKNKLSRQINQLTGRLNKHLEVVYEVLELNASDQVYDVMKSEEYNSYDPYAKGYENTATGATRFNFSNGNVEIIMPNDNIGLLAHELKHAHQFETGKYSIGNRIPGEYSNLFYDKHDEVEAFRRGDMYGHANKVFNISQLSGRYTSIATGPVDATVFPYTKNYLNSPMNTQNKFFQSVANSTGHALRINGVTYYKNR